MSFKFDPYLTTEQKNVLWQDFFETVPYCLGIKMTTLAAVKPPAYTE